MFCYASSTCTLFFRTVIYCVILVLLQVVYHSHILSLLSIVPVFSIICIKFQRLLFPIQPKYIVIIISRETNRNLWNYHTKCTYPCRASNNARNAIDTFAIVHALLDRVDDCARHPNKVCDLTHLVSCTKKCRHYHSIVFLSKLKYTTSKSHFLQCHSHRASVC